MQRMGKRTFWTIVTVTLIFSLMQRNSTLAAAPEQSTISRHQAQTKQSLPPGNSNHSSLAQTVTDGVTVSTEDLPMDAGPQRLHLLHLNLVNPNVRLGVVQAHQQLFSSGETVSSMAARTGAVAGINGDFFEIFGTGAPLGMVMTNGQLWQSPSSSAVLGVTSSGRLTIGPESFSGSVIAGNTSYPLHSINRYGDISGDNLVLFTPTLGASIPTKGGSIALLHPARNSTNTFTIQSVQPSRASLPILNNESALVGTGMAKPWLAHLKPGDTISIAQHLAPGDDLVQAIGGGPMLIKDGTLYHDPLKPVIGANPLTAIGVSKDGTHALMVVCDGHQSGARSSKGLTYTQMASYLLAHGAYQAMVFDGGGSSELAARLPGQRTVSVINTPTDGQERPVANGLFVYSRETTPGPAKSIVINENQPLTLFTGTTVPVSAYALDALGNPAADPIRFSVIPRNLATISNGTITVKAGTGRGILVAQAGHARATVPLKVVDYLASLQVTPAMPDVMNGQHVQFHLMGRAAGNATVPLPESTAHWKVDPSSLGTITANGLFTASSTAVEVGTVTATIRNTIAKASIAVGSLSTHINPLTDLKQWGLSDHYLNVYPRNVPSPGVHSVSTGSIALNTSVKRLASDAGSMDLHYQFLQGQHVSHLDPYTNYPNSLQIPLRCGKQAPVAIGIWVKGNPHLLMGPGMLNFSMGFYEADNTPIAFHAGTVTSDGWTFMTAQIPQALSYPLRVNYVSIVVINPPATETGDIYLSDLQALYTPRLLACRG